MDLTYAVEFFIVMLTCSMIVIKPTNSQVNIGVWAARDQNDLNRTPIVKHAQLFNHGAGSYVRIKHRIVDAVLKNQTDPDTYLQIDMFGPTLMAIRSYQTGEYICHNLSTGYVEVKTITDLRQHLSCAFIKERNKSYISYRSKWNQGWFFSFHFKGMKKGRPKKARKTKFTNKGSMYIENDLKLPLKQRSG